MAKNQSEYSCQACGALQPKWGGKCDACGGWNTLVEEKTSQIPGTPKSKALRASSATEFVSLDAVSAPPERITCGIQEFDRVLGGGFVQSSALLIGGDPGIGKSTLLLQVAGKLANMGQSIAYISGEESAHQIQSRALRLGYSKAAVALATETDLRAILKALRQQKPDFVIIDSIQTLWNDALDAAPGTVSQIRACCQELVRWTKKNNASMILVGHVTKEGQIAGPRVVEHLVDGVFYFEGERDHQFRILRAVKNRYGPTDEIGIFEMVSSGLKEANDPSRLFLDESDIDGNERAVFVAMEGIRPVLGEVQALTAQTSFGTPRRAVVGWEQNRLAMLLAVLETRCGLSFGHEDVYLSVNGGYKLSEPAGDLAAAAALLSCKLTQSLPTNAAFIGEVALSGAIRSPAKLETRLKECIRLGFRRIFLSLKHGTKIADMLSDIGISSERLEIVNVQHIGDLVRTFEQAAAE